MTEPHQVAQAIQAQTIYVLQPPPRGLSITALVLGLCSIVFGFTFLVPLGALIFGVIGVKREPAGKGMAVTGIVIGSLFMLLWTLIIVGPILLLTIASFYTMSTGATY